jgi:hypothetical protein
MPALVKIKLLKPVVVKGHPNANVGDILEVTPHTFQVLEGLGAAVDATNTRIEQPPETIETREPVVENRDPEVSPQTPPVQSSGRKRAR